MDESTMCIYLVRNRLCDVTWDRDPGALLALPVLADLAVEIMEKHQRTLNTPEQKRNVLERDCLHALCMLTCTWLGIRSGPNAQPLSDQEPIDAGKLGALYRFTLGELRKNLSIGITAGGTPVKSPLDAEIQKELQDFQASPTNWERARRMFTTKIATPENIWHFSGMI